MSQKFLETFLLCYYIYYMKITFKPCSRRCSGNESKRIKPGFYEKDGLIYECECHLEFRKKNKIAHLINDSNLKEEIIDYDINSYVGKPDNINRLKTLLSKCYDPDEFGKNVWLYIYGPNTSQKTTVASWVGRELLLKDWNVKFILMNDLIKLLEKANSFNPSDEVLKKLKSIESADCLIIDESFDREKITIYQSNFQIPFLDSFLRQLSSKICIFVSNKDINEIDLSESIKKLVDRNVKKYNGKMLFDDVLTDSFDFDKGVFF